MPTIVPIKRISILEHLREDLGKIQLEIIQERNWIVDRNFYDYITNDEYVLLEPTVRFNNLYNEAFKIIDRIERLTR